MIDLHIHTTNSDGKLTVIEMLKLAEEKKLDYISFTDHDDVGAYAELKNIKVDDYFSGKIIPGTELRFLYHNNQLEVLGFGYDYDKIKNSRWVNKESYHALKQAILKHLLENSKKMGFVYNKIEYSYDVKPEIIFFEELTKHEENLKILKEYDIEHTGHFYRKLLMNVDSPLYFDSSKFSLNLKQAVDLIHNAGGVAILAHPFGVYDIKNPKEMIDNILAENLVDGLECYHSDMTEENSAYLVNLCKEKNLLMSGGSDYHNYPGQFFAKANKGKLDIQTSVIDKLLNKIDKNRIID